jgi:hypothetical protein
VLSLVHVSVAQGVQRVCGWDDIKKLGRYDLRGCAELVLDHGDHGPRIGDEGAFELARALASESGIGVVKLSLVDQAIGVAGLAELAETLKTHPVLMSLDVGGNPIGKPGAAILAEALQVNHVLSSLYFVPEDDGTGSAAAVAEAIVEALSCNSQLQDNRVAERGAEAARCKAKLARYVETAQADINAAVQAQAQLEAQMQRKQASSTPPPRSAPPQLGAEQAHPCADDHSECPTWAAAMECVNNPVFMHAHCRKSCDQCPTHKSLPPSKELPPPDHPPTLQAADPGLPPPDHPPTLQAADPGLPPPDHPPTLQAADPEMATSSGHQAPLSVQMEARRLAALQNNFTPPAGTEAAQAVAQHELSDDLAVKHLDALRTDLHGEMPLAGGPAPEASTLTPEQAAQKSEAQTRELLRWLSAHELTEAAHLPILRALGVQRVSGTVGSLAPLQLLSFSELSAELQGAALPCSPTCAADKAAVYQALQRSSPK